MVGERVVDTFAVARAVAADLSRLFGARLVDVVVFGSYATDSATQDSDLDLAVVVRDVESAWEDARRKDDLLWTKTLESGITISAAIADAADWE